MLKKDAIKIVLDELVRRLPKTNRDGFLPSKEVYEAICVLSKVKVGNATYTLSVVDEENK